MREASATFLAARQAAAGARPVPASGIMVGCLESMTSRSSTRPHARTATSPPKWTRCSRWSGTFRDPAAGPPRSVLELAAGPAEHARELARRGLEATALDLSAAMCARAGDLAKADGLSLTVVEADMRDFRLPGEFDLAITMLNSLCHLLSLDDMLRHLASVARHLAPGGLYIVELAHPADFFAAERRTSTEWTSAVAAATVSVRWGGDRTRSTRSRRSPGSMSASPTTR